MIKYLSALQKLVPVKICRYLQIHGWRELCTLFGERQNSLFQMMIRKLC